LSRLSQLDEILNQGTPTYALLDEILKGTNSRDKEEGSKAFVRKLTSRKVSAIVATHDLGLCELESEFPERIRNQSFDVLIDQDELRFDYTLKDGICTQMNATFLLRKMGIVE
jgi:DNA mismatch repair ATPase MutS